jgi:hypothetical protein
MPPNGCGNHHPGFEIFGPFIYFFFDASAMMCKSPIQPAEAANSRDQCQVDQVTGRNRR